MSNISSNLFAMSKFKNDVISMWSCRENDYFEFTYVSIKVLHGFHISKVKVTVHTQQKFVSRSYFHTAMSDLDHISTYCCHWPKGLQNVSWHQPQDTSQSSRSEYARKRNLVSPYFLPCIVGRCFTQLLHTTKGLSELCSKVKSRISMWQWTHSQNSYPG